MPPLLVLVQSRVRLHFVQASWLCGVVAAWNYARNGRDWSNIGVCGGEPADAKAQSPIDLSATKASSGDASKVFMRYPDVGKLLSIYNSGVSLDMTLSEAYQAGFGMAADESGLSSGDADTFRLWQINFHSPAEHTVDGQRFPLEMQMVHQLATGSSSNQVAIVSVLFADNGVYNNFLDTVSGNGFPTKPGREVHFNVGSGVAPDFGTGLREVLFGSRFYQYDGSFTTPPCSTKVKRLVREQVVAAHGLQLGKFRKVLGAACRPNGNYRSMPSWTTAGSDLQILQSVDTIEGTSSEELASAAATISAMTAEPSESTAAKNRAMIEANPDFEVFQADDPPELREAKLEYQQAALNYESRKTASSDAEHQLSEANSAYSNTAGVVKRIDAKWDVLAKEQMVSAAYSQKTETRRALDKAIAKSLKVYDRLMTFMNTTNGTAGYTLGSSIASKTTTSSNGSSAAAASAWVPTGQVANPFAVYQVAESEVRYGVGKSNAPARLSPILLPEGGLIGIDRDSINAAFHEAVANATESPKNDDESDPVVVDEVAAVAVAPSREVTLTLPLNLANVTNTTQLKKDLAEALANSSNVTVDRVVIQDLATIVISNATTALFEQRRLSSPDQVGSLSGVLATSTRGGDDSFIDCGRDCGIGRRSHLRGRG
eukprot:TRINITY_DN38241_c0_g1_i1.p1 TRINITY_DN38241_c0_g1~~TRINITY_DN38241_c0_g1_i1.p1  ORF type:complete len:658 (+),score=104.83 TRINITY_DN38241_c0_g1_i1:107-2080(+)